LHKEFLDQLNCPNCKSNKFHLLDLIKQTSQINEGIISCNKCNLKVNIINGIPRFVNQDNYTNNFGIQWNIHSKTQLDSYTNLSITHDRFYDVTGWKGQIKGEKILEVGSGAGRFTEVLLESGAEVTSFDYSDAVVANYNNNYNKGILYLFQGDILNMPLKKHRYDKVLCLGVLQHTPDPYKSFLKLIEMVRPGGQVVIDIYKIDYLSYIQWKYLLRPITKNINKESLYAIISKVTPCLMPIARFFRIIGGSFLARMVPVVDYSHLGLNKKLNREWSVLDTFDMYSPKYDNPRSLKEVQSWFEKNDFDNISVEIGINGIIGKGRKI